MCDKSQPSIGEAGPFPSDDVLFAAYWKDQQRTNFYAHGPAQISEGLRNVWMAAIRHVQAPSSARNTILEEAAKECDAISARQKCDPVCDPCESHCGFESSACAASIRRISRGEPSYFTNVRIAPATTATGPVGSTDGKGAKA